MNDSKKTADCQTARKFCVYVIWCAVTNKYYVGVTYQKPILRIRQHKKGKQFIDSEIKRIGWQGNWDWWLVEENISPELIDEREKFWVEFFNSVYPNGYNRTHGGIGKICVSEETRALIRENALARDYSGEKNPHYGKHHTEETRAIISAKMKGKRLGISPTNKGVPHTEEARAKMSAAHKGEKNHFFGKHHTEEAKAKISKANSGKPSPQKGKAMSEETKAKLREKALERDVSGERNPFYGKKHTEESREKMSAANIGHTPWNKGKTMSEESRAKMRAAALARIAKKKSD